MFWKNTAGQKALVYAYNKTTGAAKTGDAGNITGSVSLDGGAPAALTDTNPTEIGGGWYAFDLTQAETNGAVVCWYAASGTADVLVEGAAVYATDAAVIADAVLSRDASNVEASAGEHTLCTLVLAALESAVSGTAWTIYRTDGATTHATKTLTLNPGAAPVTGVA